MIKIFNHFVQSLIIYFFFILAKLIGIRLSRNFFSFIFLKIGPLFKSKKIVQKNLAIFNQNLSENDKKIILSQMWKNYGMTFIEYIFLDHLKKNTSNLKVVGADKVIKIIQSGKQVVFISGHFANFELMSMEITRRNIKLATIYRPLNNIFLNPFMEYLRRKYICKNQIKKGINGLRDAINYIKKGYNIALMIDQRLSEGEEISFFSKKAKTTTLPAQLALKYNLSVIPVFIQRKDKEKFEIKFLDQIEVEKYRDKIELSKKLNGVLEKMILKNPYQWIWTHDRWK
tara:strand:- start:1712 stop:2569 length:858 start_codon:yes stop_codon:yes gene_type:complete